MSLPSFGQKLCCLLWSVSLATAATPGISAVSPDHVDAAGPGFALRVQGENFQPGAVVRWAGVPLPTSFQSVNELTAQVPAASVALAGRFDVTVVTPDGVISNNGSSVIVHPVLSGISPLPTQTSSYDQFLVVSGAGFTRTTVIQLTLQGQQLDLPTTYTSDSMLSIVVPASAMASPAILRFAVVDITTGASSRSMTSPIQRATTYLMSLDPSAWSAGGSDLQLSVSVLDYASDALVRWNDVILTPKSRGQSVLTVVVPSNLMRTPGTAKITVLSDGLVSNSLPFSIVDGPVILRTSQAYPQAGGPEFRLDIYGSGFTQGVEAYWSGTPIPTLHQGSNWLICTVPAKLLALAGGVSLTVKNRDGAVSPPWDRISVSPAMSAIRPSSAFLGSPPIDLEISGTGFTPETVAGMQLFNSEVKLEMTYVSSSTLKARIPASAMTEATTAMVFVALPGWGWGSVLPFVVGTPALQIKSVSPSSSIAGGSGFELRVKGNEIKFTTQLRWNGQALPATWNGVELIAAVPANLIASPGIATITLISENGSVSNAVPFPVVGGDLPVITAVDARQLIAGGPAVTLTITGAGFQPGVVVYWNKTPLTTKLLGVTQLQAVVPANLLAQEATISITVTNPGGTPSIPVVLTVQSATPVISSLLPAAFTAGSSGTTLTVIGSGFRLGASVLWNGRSLAVTSNASTRLTASVPAELISSPGKAEVKVISGGLSSNSLNISVNAVVATPTLTAIGRSSLDAGGPGFTLPVTGSNFQPGATVKWGGTPLPTIFVSTSELTATVPESLVAVSGRFDVTVANLGGADSFGWPVFLSPVLSDISPSLLPAASSGETITVTGAGFRPASYVYVFRGSQNWTLETTCVSSRVLSAKVPADFLKSPTSAFVVVADRQEYLRSKSMFLHVAAIIPGITSFLPNSATAGGSGFQLTVNGTNFAPGAVLTWDESPLDTTFVGPTLLNAAVPSSRILAPGTSFLAVANPDATSTSVSFPIKANGPVISALDPAEVTAGGASFTLAVTGAGFQPSDTVLWNGTPLPTQAAASSGLTAVVPAAAIAQPGGASVTIAGTSGTESLAVALMVNPANPVITVITPDSATEGSGPFTLKAAGKGFLPGAVVVWNGQPQETVFVNAGLLTARLRAELVASAGEASVTITNPAGAESAVVTYRIEPPVPMIVGISPSSATAGGGDFPFEVRGSGFLEGAAILWDGVELATTFVDSTHLEAAIPGSWIPAAGPNSISVSNPGGLSSTTSAFKVLEPSPKISGTAPAALVAGGDGAVLTVSGTGYLPGTVLGWEGTTLETAFVNPTRLTARVPAALMSNSGTAQLTTVSPAGDASKPWVLTIVALRVTGFGQQAAMAGGPDTTLTVLGEGFQPGAVVYWDGVPLSTTFADGVLAAAVPARLIASVGSARIAVAIPGGVLSNTKIFPITVPSGDVPE